MTEPPSQKELEAAKRSQGARRTLRRSVFPGLLALGWMVYLLLAAGKTFFVTRPIFADAAYFEAAMREMLLIVAVGLTILWPLVRLSQRHARPTTLLLLDAVVLLALAQIVIWPLLGQTHWPALMLFQVDALLAAWTLLAGGLVALGICFRAVWWRSLMVLLCAAAIFAAPVGLALGIPADPPPWFDFASPLAAIWRLEASETTWPGYVLELAGAVACGGTVLIAIGAVARSHRGLGS
ncbi:MAG: hypothetical protein ACF8NJ_09355 [Phycisphaerales bacterium JB038]